MTLSTLVDLVKIQIASTGTGIITLGSPVQGYRGFEALVDGNTYSYSIQQNGNYEVGTGTYLLTGHRFVRSPQVSSAGGGTIDLAPGAALVFTARAADFAVPGTDGANGETGPRGRNGDVTSNLTIGTFVGAAGQDLTAGGTKPAPLAVLTAAYDTPVPPYAAIGGGWYVLDPVVDAPFVTSHPGWSFLDSESNGYRLSKEQTVRDTMFGTVADANMGTPGTYNDNAWLAIKDFIHYFRTWIAGDYYYKDSVPVNWGQGGYEFSSGFYLDLDDAAYHLYGSSSTGTGGGAGTVFFSSNSCGMVLQSWDTAGVSLINQPNDYTQPYHHGASGSCIKNIMLISRTGTIGAEQHGLLVKCTGCTFEHVSAHHFGGDGIHEYADTPTHAGNANCNRFESCGGHNCGGSGGRTGGADSNAGIFNHFQANFNRQFAIAEGSFLGGKWKNFHRQSNGMPRTYGAGPFWAATTAVPGCRAIDGGKTYAVLPGKDSLAATSQPSTSPTVWVKVSDTMLPWVEGWTSGHLYCSGGAGFIGTYNWLQNNANESVFDGYTEYDQAPGFNYSLNAVGIGTGASGNVLYGKLGALVAQMIGCASLKSDGSNILALLGGGADELDTWLKIGRNDSTSWRGKISTTDTLTFDYNNLGNSQPLGLNAPGTGDTGAFVPRGIQINNSPHMSAAAAPTSGYLRHGTIFWNEAGAAGGSPGWYIVAPGGTGTYAWIATVAWAASHAYVVGDLVTNDTGKSYRCITAGTSASSGGPTGTGTNITDGTAHWAYSAGFTAKALANMAA